MTLPNINKKVMKYKLTLQDEDKPYIFNDKQMIFYNQTTAKNLRSYIYNFCGDVLILKKL